MNRLWRKVFRNRRHDTTPLTMEWTNVTPLTNPEEKGACYSRLFGSPDGEKVFADLIQEFNGTTLKKAPDKTIDSNASLAAAGRRDVILYIHYWRDRNAFTRRIQKSDS